MRFFNFSAFVPMSKPKSSRSKKIHRPFLSGAFPCFCSLCTYNNFEEISPTISGFSRENKHIGYSFSFLKPSALTFTSLILSEYLCRSIAN